MHKRLMAERLTGERLTGERLMHISRPLTQEWPVMQLGCITMGGCQPGYSGDAVDVHQPLALRGRPSDMHHVLRRAAADGRYSAHPGPMGYSGALSAR